LGIDPVRTARIQIMTASLGPVKTHTPEECRQIYFAPALGAVRRR
jgi:hypothetical protein